jgi:hypothetical protein
MGNGQRTAFFSSSQTRSWFLIRSGCQLFFMFRSPPPILAAVLLHEVQKVSGGGCNG